MITIELNDYIKSNGVITKEVIEQCLMECLSD